MINKSNTIYHIQYDYDLNGAEITIPEGCVLQFEGGSLSNGAVNGDNTVIRNTGGRTIFYSISFLGYAVGQKYFDVTLNKPIYWNGTKWVDEKGFTAAISRGTTAQRPTSLMTADDKGYEYYDTTLNMPIYWDGNSRWVDKEGRLAGIHSGDTASRPLNSELTSGDAGYQYFNIETLELQIWVGNTWETVSFANQ